MLFLLVLTKKNHHHAPSRIHIPHYPLSQMDDPISQLHVFPDISMYFFSSQHINKIKNCRSIAVVEKLRYSHPISYFCGHNSTI